MRIVLIGRTKILLDSLAVFNSNGHEVVGIITSKASEEYKVDENDFSDIAEQLNIPFLHHPKIDLASMKKYFSDVNADIGVSINYSGIISQAVIDFFPFGILNAHGGDLPKYRGNACQAWAIINGENRIGLCIHRMIGGELDNGDIVARAYFKLNINSRIEEVYDFFELKIPSLFLESIEKLGHQKNYYLEKQSTFVKDSLRCYPRAPEDGKINWEADSQSIIRLINASSEPYQGAYAYLDDKKVIIWRAELENVQFPWVGVPGQIAEIKNDGSVQVLCGQGQIKLTLIEVDKKKVKPNELFNSIRKRLR